MSRKLTLPTDSSVRKDIPLYSGCYTYFPAALAGVAMHSKMGNDKHNPGEPLHHARGKSTDHADCIARHSMDLADMLARKAVWTAEEQAAILSESRALSWRSLAWAQEIEEMFGAPLAPAARESKKDLVSYLDSLVPNVGPACNTIPQPEKVAPKIGGGGAKGHTWAGAYPFAGRETELFRVCTKCDGIHNLPMDSYVNGYFAQEEEEGYYTCQGHDGFTIRVPIGPQP